MTLSKGDVMGVIRNSTYPPAKKALTKFLLFTLLSRKLLFMKLINQRAKNFFQRDWFLFKKQIKLQIYFILFMINALIKYTWCVSIKT